MWKINLGFVLALAVLGLSGLGSYDSVRQLLEDGRQAQDDHAARLTALERGSTSVNASRPFRTRARGSMRCYARKRRRPPGKRAWRRPTPIVRPGSSCWRVCCR